MFIGFCFSDRLSRGQVAALAVSFGLMVFAKYTPVAMLPLVALIPQPEGLRAGRGKTARSRWLVAAACLAGAALVYALLTAYTGFASNYGALPYADTGVRPGEQLRFILSNPPRYLAVFLYSLYRDKANLSMLGNFGWMDMNVPFVSVFSPLVLLFSAGMSALEGAREKPRTGWACALTAALLYAFTYAGMYLTSTPVSLPEINGVQSRYLLGAFFALLVLARHAAGPHHGAGQAAPRPAAEDPARLADAASGVLFFAGFGPAAVPILLYRPLKRAFVLCPRRGPAPRPETPICGRIT